MILYQVKITDATLADKEDIYAYIAQQLMERIMQWGSITELLMQS